MKDYTYEVRGVNDPIEGEVVRFHSKQEALNYSDEMKSLYPDNTVYMVEWEFDDEFGFDGAPTKTQEMQIRGPEVDANLADPTVPNSCDGDNPVNYDEEGNFRLPAYDDGLDEDIVEKYEQVSPFEYKCGNGLRTYRTTAGEIKDTVDKFGNSLSKDTKTQPQSGTASNSVDLTKAEDPKAELDKFASFLDEGTDEGLVGADDIPVDENLDNSDDDIESESFAEELFSALSTKRSEEVFPKGDLDLEAPHKDVPVVDCDVNPVITHSEDEKPLVESKQQNLISFDFNGNLEGCHFDIYNGDYEHADGLPTKPNQLWIDATINIDPEDGPSYTESNGYTWEEFDDKFYRFFDVSIYRELEDDDAITSELAEKLIQTIPTDRRDDFVSTLTDDIVEYNRNHSDD